MKTVGTMVAVDYFFLTLINIPPEYGRVERAVQPVSSCCFGEVWERHVCVTTHLPPLGSLLIAPF
jgi:hypothetical protein